MKIQGMQKILENRKNKKTTKIQAILEFRKKENKQIERKKTGNPRTEGDPRNPEIPEFPK